MFCRDEAGVIGQGVHKRCVIQPEAFMAKVDAKALAAGLIAQAA